MQVSCRSVQVQLGGGTVGEKKREEEERREQRRGLYEKTEENPSAYCVVTL